MITISYLKVCDVTLIDDTPLPTSEIKEPTYINSDMDSPDNEQAKDITVAAAAIGTLLFHLSMVKM